MDSILRSIKKLIGFDLDSPFDEGFDLDLISEINTALFAATQLGVGPTSGMIITGPTETWSQFISDPLLISIVTTFVKIKVKLSFDPPASQTIIDALKNSEHEYAWRIDHYLMTKPNQGGTYV